MNDYNDWAARHPQAAADLQRLLGAVPWPTVPAGGDGKSEPWSQQQVRFKVAHAGAMGWRNNVGATPAKTDHTCPRCRFEFQQEQQPVRYGLANDSAQLNKKIKSSDLILAIPRVIRPQDVGQTIAQFGSVETKRPGWVYTGKGQEPGQAAWLALIRKLGGYAAFSTGDIEL